MSAGLPAMNKNGSSRAQLRNQLLNSDIGSIDVANETPMNTRTRAAPAAPPAPQYQHQVGYQQQPYYNGPQPPVAYQQQPYEASYGGAGVGATPRRLSASAPVPAQSSSSKMSLQSGGLSNLFKLRHGRAKEKDDDDDEDTVMADTDTSVVTFNDISSLRNNGGHKYGFGAALDDTTPIIPTIITREHDNMNNIEYRKHISAQKKMAMSAAAKQGKQQRPSGGFPIGGPRAMSLQSSYNPYQHPGPHPAGPGAIPPYARANSMMSGPPQRFRQYPPDGAPPPGQGSFGPQSAPGGPRAMSLTSNRRPGVPPLGMPQIGSPGFVPGPQQPYYGNGPRAMSLQGPRPQMYANNAYGRENTSREMMPRQGPQGPQRHPVVPASQGSQGPQTYPAQAHPGQAHPGQAHPGQHLGHSHPGVQHPQGPQGPPGPQGSPFTKGHATTPPSSSSLTSSNSRSSDYVSSETPESQLGDEPAKQTMAASENEHTAHRESPLKHEIAKTGKLNILKLSDPQQQELREREHQVGQKQHNRVSNEELHRRNLSEISAEPGLDLRPSSMLESGLGSLTLDDSPKIARNVAGAQQDDHAGDTKNAKHQSITTLRSSYSLDSPIKKRTTKNGLYKLENDTDANGYVTASQFLDVNNEDVTSTSNQSEITIKKNDTSHSYAKSDTTLPSAEVEQVDSKAKGFGKARNFLKRISSRQSKSEKEGPHSRSSSIASINKRHSSVDSIPSLQHNDVEPGTLWNQKNEKRKSFHSLFSNSSTNILQSETHATPKPLADIQEGGVSEKSPPLGQNLVTDSTKLYHNEIPDSHFDVRENRTDGSNIGPIVELPPSSSINNSDDDFVFDNSVGRPYKPLFASMDDLEPAVDLQDRKKFKTICISGEQLSALNERNSLMDELELISKELAESIAREANLEQQLLAREPDADPYKNLSLSDFEIELRKKSSKIVELIQELNDERLKRYIAEEQILLREHGVKPNPLDLVYKIQTLNKEITKRDNEISLLKEHLNSQNLNSAFK